MSKIVLNDVVSAANVSVVNSNFQKIEDALNDAVLYRDNPPGEPNAMENNLDMNGKRIYNLPAPASPSEPVRLQDIEGINGENSSDDVTRWGAVGDGITDDTAAIQSAINESLTLNFGDSSRTFRITGTLVGRNGSKLRAQGAKIKQETRQRPALDFTDKDNWSVKGFVFEGVQLVTVAAGSLVIGEQYSIVTPGTTNWVAIGSANNTAGRFFTATGVGSGTGLASQFYNTPNSQDIAIKATSSENCIVEENTFYYWGYSPMMMSLWGRNVKFINNIVYGPGAGVLNPLGLSDPQNPGFRNNTGVTILGHDVEISGNVFKDTSQGFYIGQQSTNVYAGKNVVLNTIVEHGMYCDAGVKNVQIVDNEFNSCKLNGYKVQNYDDIADVPENIVISGNTLDGAGGDGIVIINAGTNTIATITNITNANPAVITTSGAHGLAVDQKIVMSGIGGMTTLNSAFYVASIVSPTQFTIKTAGGVVDSTSVVDYPPYTSGGGVQRPVFTKNITITGNTLKNITQDAISLRFVDGAIVQGNTVDTGARVGVYQLYSLNIDVAGNLIRNIQQNGIYVFSPYDQCSVFDNTLLNVGAGGIDTGGASSGIFVEGDGGGNIFGNIVKGEPTRTKMLNGIHVGSGDKTQWSIADNQVYDAESAVVALHTLDTRSLRLDRNNTGTAATGENARAGLPESLPLKGHPDTDIWGTVAPSTGFWQQGKREHFLYPAAGQAEGALNVSAGTPGTWRARGIVHNVAPSQALSGTYTPTVTTVGNCDSVTSGVAIYSVHGNICTVSGLVTMDATSAGVSTTWRLSFPIASAVGASGTNVAGVFCGHSTTAGQAGGIFHDGTNDAAYFQCIAATATAVPIRYTYSYVLF